MGYFAKIELMCLVFAKLAKHLVINWPFKTFEEPINFTSDKKQHILNQLYQHSPVIKSKRWWLNCHILSFELQCGR